MKKILIIVSSLIFSCQSENKSVIEVIESNNIDLIKLKREEINNKQQKIYEELNLIDLKLDELENNSKKAFKDVSSSMMFPPIFMIDNGCLFDIFQYFFQN